MRDHCEHCPVDAGLRCASEDHARYCDLAAREAGRPGYWADSIRRRSSRAPAGPRPRDGFPPAPPRDGRVRVGLWCPCLAAGGAEAWQLALARHTDRSRVEWMGCAVVGGHGTLEPAMLEATSALMPVASGVDAARELAARCDVLIPWAIDGLEGLLAPVSPRPKVVSVVHAPPESAWGRTVYARPAGIDRWVAVSDLALEALPPSARPVPSTVIPNCVDTGRLEVRRSSAEMRRAWGVAEDAPVAGYLGRLSHEKEPRAMARLAAALPDPWRIVVVGGGSEAMPPDPSGRLALAGVDVAAGDVLNAFDVLVVPSEYESFGLTIAEGLWMRKPVVSTDVGIARLNPGITRLIPFKADGPTLARAVLIAHAGGPTPEAAAFLPSLAPDRFGREWTELLCSTAGSVENGNSDNFHIAEPTLASKAASVIKAVVKHVAAGCPTRTEGRQAELKAICLGCPQQLMNASQCSVCGCSRMDWKRSMKREVCPAGKWPEDEP